MDAAHVVHQQVDATEARHGLVDERLGAGRGRQVVEDDDHLALVGEGTQVRGTVQRAGGDLDALPDECPRDLESDAPAGAGHQHAEPARSATPPCSALFPTPGLTHQADHHGAQVGSIHPLHQRLQLVMAPDESRARGGGHAVQHSGPRLAPSSVLRAAGLAARCVAWLRSPATGTGAREWCGC
jgi:hypothetical protein